MPPRMAWTCPSSDVPAPNGITGTPKRALIAHDLDDFVGRAGKADDVGRRRRVVRLAVAVMLAHGVGIAGARAEQLFELRDRRVNHAGR